MLIQPQRTKKRARRRGQRPLNLAGIKKFIVLITGTITAFGSGVTGLGGQIAYSPLLTWMLGFPADKANANGMNFAFVAALSAIAGMLASGAAELGSAHLIPGGWRFLISGISLFVGALVGALVGAPLWSRMKGFWNPRWSYSLGVAICLWVVVWTGKLSRFDGVGIAGWQTMPRLVLLGSLVGVLTRLFSLPSGLLMVPALYYIGAFTPSESIALSLLVVALASLLPTLSYSRSGRIDSKYIWQILLSAVLGGFVGGRILPPDHFHVMVPHRNLIIISAVVSMFLCARELARSGTSSKGESGPAYNPPPQQESS